LTTVIGRKTLPINQPEAMQVGGWTNARLRTLDADQVLKRNGLNRQIITVINDNHSFSQRRALLL